MERETLDPARGEMFEPDAIIRAAEIMLRAIPCGGLIPSRLDRLRFRAELPMLCRDRPASET